MVRMITKEKSWKLIGKQIKLGIVLLSLLILLVPLNSKAAGMDFNAKVKELQTKFPHQKYWNHVGMDEDNSDGYTDYPCELHRTSGVDHIYGTDGCTCNHFAGGGHLLATQCMGFANKLGYEVFGETTWAKVDNPDAAQIANIKAGDIVRIDGYHSVFVIGRTGNMIAVGEANYPNGCQISWGRTIDLTTVTVSCFEHAVNYDSVIDSIDNSGDEEEENPPEDTEEESEVTKPEIPSDFTGWKKAKDGKHYQYYINGKLQKKKWLKISKKKYYVNKQGYRVTGLVKIGRESYYFNSKGQLQKKKWVKFEDNYYYVAADGYVLKSQWLYHNNRLVYVKSSGAVAKNELVKIGKKTYYFDAKERRSKGFKKYKGKYYYSDSKGIIQKKKWIIVKGKKYYLQKSGARVQNKLIKIGKYRFYFNNKGQLQKKKTIIYKGGIYKADKKGRCKFVDYCETEEEY